MPRKTAPRRTIRFFAGLAFAVAAALLLTHDHVSRDVETEALIHGLTPSRPWVLVEGKSWEIQSTESEDPVLTDAAEGTRGSCPPGMVEVQGAMKIDSERGNVEYLQDATCSHWINRDFPERCAAFDRDRWLALSRDLPTRQTHFCIDRFEHPNRKGAYPVIAVTWYEARARCDSLGERLCTEDEWTFACEGEEATPYPTGYARNEEACVMDRPWRLFDEHRLAIRDSTLALAEIDYAWQGEASGSHPLCRSVFGVYDMTGNVDEWTSSVQREGFRSVFKGGYWGPVRARCRASTRAHNEDFYFYQQGFRCCADVPPADAAPAEEDGAGPPSGEPG
jgi:formylglycine-generating enzyme required for sulfatase activity